MPVPAITLQLIRQEGLDDRARTRAWRLVRSEILAALEAHAVTPAKEGGATKIGASSLWSIHLNAQGTIIVAPAPGTKGSSLLQVRIREAHRALDRIAADRKSLMSRPQFVP
jgi:hypothetical protein